MLSKGLSLVIECISRRLDRSRQILLASVGSMGVSYIIVITPACLAQPPSAATTAKMEFDVASVRENKSGLPPSGVMPKSNFPLGPGAMYSPNGGLFSTSNQPLLVYIMFAYKMTDHEVQALSKQLPNWTTTERFDIEAKTDNRAATKDDMRLMIQSLLAERFKLAVHTVTEEIPVYALVLAKPGKTGPKLQPHPESDTSCSNAPPPASSPDSAPVAAQRRTVAGGFPVICGGAAYVPPSVPGRFAVGYRNVPLKLIAVQMTLMGGLGRPVIDQTGLTGNFDFLIEFSPERSPGVDPPANLDTTGPTFQQALSEQDGLKLISQKSMVDKIIIDHVEYPSAN
jgi:uncharacterized protein (TIGR03435 family)